MSDVSFNEEQNLTSRYVPATSKKGGISGLIIRLGVAGNERQANIVMIAIIIIAVVIMGFIWLTPSSTPSSATVPSTNPVPQTTP